MAIIKNKSVFYNLKMDDGKEVRMIDCARTDRSEYPLQALNIRPYDEYEMLAEELLPCPFCGEKAERLQIVAARENDNPPIWSHTKCSNKECLCSFKSVDAKIWNKRVFYQEK